MAKTLSVNTMELLEEADIPDEVQWTGDPISLVSITIIHLQWKGDPLFLSFRVTLCS